MTGHIVIIGGGFAGFWGALAAKRVGGESVRVTLVSREPVLVIRPRLYEAHPHRLGVDVLPLLGTAGVAFEQGQAVGLHPDRRTVGLSSGAELSYDRLVVATGSAMRRPPVQGAEDAYSIDSLPEAIAFDRRLAEVARDGAAPTVAVVGAGFTGIELALELRDRVAVHGGRAMGERLRILLVDRADVVGPELGPGPRPVIEAALAEAGVELVLSASVTLLGADRLTTADGITTKGDAVVLATGMGAQGFARHVPGTHDHLGRVLVDRFLRAPAAPQVFVAGDAAGADGGDGHPVLQSCQHALQLGRFAGENAARDLLGPPMIPYVQPPYITCLDLGRSGAVYTGGWERTVVATGAEAKARKRRINTDVIYPPRDATREELLALSSVDPARQRLRRAGPPMSTLRGLG
jgi:NADH dehydrogenase